jgi:hypothetical protein
VGGRHPRNVLSAVPAFTWWTRGFDDGKPEPMAEPERLPDDAFVVRCGRPPFSRSPLLQACRKHPEGPHGFSVQTAGDLTVEQLAVECPNT